jgi:hypothetical protein
MKCLTIAALLSVLALAAGCDPPTYDYVATGTVRSVWCQTGSAVQFCDVTFEHDSGRVQSLSFYYPVPLWTGLHATLHYRSASSTICRLEQVER